MEKSKSNKPPSFVSLDELVEFFDTHDMGEYWDQMPEARFEIDIKGRRHVFAIEEDLADKLTEVAKSRRIPSGVLINSWLREKLLGQEERT